VSAEEFHQNTSGEIYPGRAVKYHKYRGNAVANIVTDDNGTQYKFHIAGKEYNDDLDVDGFYNYTEETPQSLHHVIHMLDTHYGKYGKIHKNMFTHSPTTNVVVQSLRPRPMFSVTKVNNGYPHECIAKADRINKAQLDKWTYEHTNDNVNVKGDTYEAYHGAGTPKHALLIIDNPVGIVSNPDQAEIDKSRADFDRRKRAIEKLSTLNVVPKLQGAWTCEKNMEFYFLHNIMDGPLEDIMTNTTLDTDEAKKQVVGELEVIKKHLFRTHISVGNLTKGSFVQKKVGNTYIVRLWDTSGIKDHADDMDKTSPNNNPAAAITLNETGIDKVIGEINAIS
jgi:hypothetical protein